MESSAPKGPQISYMQTLMGWGMKGIAFLTTTPEALKKTGAEGINLLEGFSYSDGFVTGEVEAAKVRDVVKQAMDPVKSFYRAGVVMTCALFFASRVVSIFPIIPSFLLLGSVITGMITWDFHCALREMNHTYTHFNRIHLQGINFVPVEEREVRAKMGAPTVTFDQFVGVVDSYSQQILSNTWLISGFDPIETSLTSWGPHLTNQVKNQTERSKASPWDIAADYLPILPLICRVANAADRVY
ncbi:MAG: hypothetical protein KFB93_08460 [Simkaniaceae bacterium]|nr:MAG: hypothetical protein KFB93_08460 [Simkaniaceae bacterium]